MYIAVIIIGITMFFMFGALVITYGKFVVDNNGYVLGITLSEAAKSNDTVTKIVKSYMQHKRIIDLIGFVLIGGCYFLRDYTSFTIIYIFIWFAGLMLIYEHNLKKYAWIIYNLKKENDWYKTSESKIIINQSIKKLKAHSAMKAMYIYAAVIALIAVTIFGVVNQIKTAGIYGAVGLIFIIMCFAMGRMKINSYCNDKEYNDIVNSHVTFYWQLCMLIHAYGSAAASIAITLLSIYGVKETLPVIILAVISCAGSIGVILAIFNRINVVRKSILVSSDEEEYGDADYYWLTDTRRPGSSVMEEKRVGIGLSINGGKPVGYVVFGLSLAFVLGISIYMYRFDVADIAMSFEGDRIEIQAADISYSFKQEEIENVELLEQYPDMSKNSGYNGGTLNLGDFHVSGYGDCEVFVSLKNPQVIVVTTKNKTVIFNNEKEAITVGMYNSLTD